MKENDKFHHENRVVAMPPNIEDDRIEAEQRLPQESRCGDAAQRRWNNKPTFIDQVLDDSSDAFLDNPYRTRRRASTPELMPAPTKHTEAVWLNARLTIGLDKLSSGLSTDAKILFLAKQLRTLRAFFQKTFIE